MHKNIFLRIGTGTLASVLIAIMSSLSPVASFAKELDRVYLIDTNTLEWTELINFTTKGALSLNDSAQVIGRLKSSNDLHYQYALTGTDGAGILGIFPTSSSGSGFNLTEINISGQIAGFNSYFITGPNGAGYYPVRGNITGINDHGWVTGYDTTGAFITGPNGRDFDYLFSLGQKTRPAAINNSGQIAGEYDYVNPQLPGPRSAPFITGPNGENMRELTLPPGFSGVDIIGINDSGQILMNVVSFESGYYPPASIILTGPDGTGITHILNPDGISIYGTGINDISQIVGVSGGRAYITGPNGTNLTDLNTLISLPDGQHISRVYDINNHGQILVSTAIPEPHIYAFMLVGLSIIGLLTYRRKNIS